MPEKKEKDKIRIGILRGGDYEHYESSLRKGGEIISYILENLSHKYKPFDILIDKEGNWHLNGLPIEPMKLLYKVDMVWNLSHQRFSNILESHSIKNIGIPAFSPFFEISKEKFQEKIKKMGIKMPRCIVSPKNAQEVFKRFSSPWVVKINNEIKLIKTFPELVEVFDNTTRDQKNILVEEFIEGKVASLHLVPFFRGENLYTFPFGNTFGTFTSSEKEKLINIAQKLHMNMGVRHYLKLDFILDKRNKVYLLNFEMIPDLKPESHLSQVCGLVGTNMHQVIEHIFDNVLL